MEKVMELVRESRPVRDVLPYAADLDEKQLQQFSSALTDKEVTQLSDWATRTLNYAGIEMVLWSGGVLSIFNAATASESRRVQFKRLIRELRISETQAYRNMAVWKRAGKTLMDNPELIEKFAAESLKILCGKHCSADALESAFESARHGFYIDIQTARELRQEHAAKPSCLEQKLDQVIKVELSPSPGVSEESSETPPSEREPIGGTKRFTGRVVEIALKFLARPSSVDQQAILDDFLTFANQISESVAPEDHVMHIASN